MKFNLKDIVLTTPEYGNRKLTIVAIDEDFYWGKEGKKKYKITDEQIEQKVGVVESIEEEPPLSTEQQQRFCLSKSKIYPTEKDSWLYLSRLRSGDKIKLIHRMELRLPFSFR